MDVYVVEAKQIEQLEIDFGYKGNDKNLFCPVDPLPHRIISFNKTDNEERVKTFRDWINVKYKNSVEWNSLKWSSFKGVLRNVPNYDFSQQNNESIIVSVAFHNSVLKLDKVKVRAPILVLSELKYRGNIGTIIRSAVQANIFEAIYIVGSKKSLNVGENHNKSGSY
eukprot:Pgem_evm1s4821